MAHTEVTSDQIRQRFFDEAFSRPLMDNTVRGLWCEFMIAEAIGASCKPVGFAWHPWDLQIGHGEHEFPDRIRIQVKNSASLQSWNAQSGRISNPSFSLSWRNRPEYFQRDNPGIPCESQGFMCEMFILCNHPITDTEKADQRDPTRWDFYLLPVVGPNSAVTESEVNWVRDKLAKTWRPSATQRRPSTLKKRIRNRPPCPPIGIEKLSVLSIRSALGLPA